MDQTSSEDKVIRSSGGQNDILPIPKPDETKETLSFVTKCVDSVSDVYLRPLRGDEERETKIKRFLDLKHNTSHPQYFNSHLMESSDFYDPMHLKNQMVHAGIKPHQVSESLLRDFYMAPLEGFIDEIG